MSSPKFARYEDQETRVYGKDGTLHFVDTDLSGNRPEVDRGHLRRMLLDSVPPESIRWDHTLTAAEPHSDSTSTLIFPQWQPRDLRPRRWSGRNLVTHPPTALRSPTRIQRHHLRRTRNRQRGRHATPQSRSSWAAV